jgi:hypothetical protein
VARLTTALAGSVLLAAIAAGGPSGCSGPVPTTGPGPEATTASGPAGGTTPPTAPIATAPTATAPAASATAGTPSATPAPGSSSTAPVSAASARATRAASPKPPAKPPAKGTAYPWHTGIVSTTFWVGEIFDPNASDGSQVISTYNSRWLKDYGGCDGRVVGKDCRTERRTAANGWFPTRMTPKENPFYLDLPFDDVNDSVGLRTRTQVIPWAKQAKYAALAKDRNQSLMKNRWVQLKKGGRTCYGQIEDAGPGQYHDARYVFGRDDARPVNHRYGGAGMDVSPALNGCLGFAELDGDADTVSWRFVDRSAVPAGPWTRIITTSGVH